MLPSEFQEVQRYHRLKRLLEAQVDMQFTDLRTLLRLPLGEMDAGCNFAAAAMLFNLIAGSSVCFYEASPAALAERGNRGRRFQEVLERYYPWQGEPLPKADCIEVLYGCARNPLAHSLGLDEPPLNPVGKLIVLTKSPLTRQQIQELEDAPRRPSWALPTVVTRKTLASGAQETVLWVPGMYWGVHRMLHALFADPTQAAKADALAASFSPQWDKIALDSAIGTDSAREG